jgi:hypothetical protein
LNPYDSPTFGGPAIPDRRGMPTYITVLLVIDLVLLGFRALFVALASITVMTPALQQDPMVAQTAGFELAAGLLMVFTGVPAAIAMLARQPWGVWLAYAKIAATLGSMAVGAWQGTYLVAQYPPSSAEHAGAIVGIGIAMLFRSLLVGLYVFTVLQFSRWVRQSDQPASMLI